MNRRKEGNALVLRFVKLLSERYTNIAIGLICFIIVSISVLIYLNFYNATKSDAEKYAISVSRSYAIKVESEFNLLIFAAETTRSRVQLLMDSPSTNINQVLTLQKYNLQNHGNVNSIRIVYKDEGMFKTLYTYRKDGSIITAETPEFLATDLYQREKQTNSVHITHVYSENGVDVASAVLPILDSNNEYCGLVFVSVLASYFQALNDTAKPFDCETFIVDNEYRMVASPYKSNPSAKQQIDVSRGSSLGNIIATNVEDGEVFSEYIYNPIINETCLLVGYPINTFNDTHGSFCALIPESVIYRRLHETQRLIVTSIFLIVVLIVVFVIYGSFAKKKTYIDALTGLYNRQYLDKNLPIALSRSFSYKKPISIIICDIDHFKRVNDTYGHQMGDAILKHFSDILDSQLRKKDWIVRYGGEEFLVCLPSTDSKNARNIAERIRATVENSLYVDIDSGLEIGITASFGLANVAGEGLVGMIDIIKRADDNLYQAKSSGRNRVVE